MVTVSIKDLFITLGQLLKKIDLVSSGGHAKIFLMEVDVKVNQEVETRRGRKIYPQDVVEIKGYGTFKVVQE